MKLGIFARTFSRPTLEQVLDAVVDHGFTEMQFNLACAGLPTLPGRVDEAWVTRIRRGCESRGLRMAAVSGTFNMIHPVRDIREVGFAGLQALANASLAMGTEVITLCTGTRDRDNMWRGHPENNSTAAWNELLVSMERALHIAHEASIILAVEPEVSNVVDSAVRARRLLDHFQSPRLKIVMDPANLFHTGELARVHEVIGEAFKLLGESVVLAHAKDLTSDGDAGHAAAGTGVLDYDFYLQQLDHAGFAGPLVLHSLAENQVTECARFLAGKISKNARHVTH